jgi:hypothetical protein
MVLFLLVKVLFFAGGVHFFVFHSNGRRLHDKALFLFKPRTTSIKHLDSKGRKDS